MLKQGKGSIVNISSVATAGVNQVLYSAAKGGVNALTRSIAMEYSGSVFGLTPWPRAGPRRRRA